MSRGFSSQPVLTPGVPGQTAFFSNRRRPRGFAAWIVTAAVAGFVCCSSFGVRQVLYERFFQGDVHRNIVLLNSLYDREPMAEWVREFLQEE